MVLLWHHVPQNQNYPNQIAQILRKEKMFKTANLLCACDPAGL